MKTKTYLDPETGEILERARIDSEGREIVSNRPVEAALGYVPEPTLAQRIQMMVRSERLAQELDAQVETFEDADDFDVGDDYDPQSPYENEFEGLSVRELKERMKSDQEQLEKLEQEAIAKAEAEEQRTSEENEE